MIAAMLLVTPLGHGAPGETKQLVTGRSEGGDLVLRCGLLINGLLDESLADQLVTIQAGRITSVESFGNVRRKIAGSAVMDLSSSRRAFRFDGDGGGDSWGACGDKGGCTPWKATWLVPFLS